MLGRKASLARAIRPGPLDKSALPADNMNAT
jgi:hypothetical protein